MLWGGSHVIIIEIECTISVMCLNHPQTTPHCHPWKNCFPQNWSWCQKHWGPLLKNTHTHTHTHTHTECITRFITSSGLKREKKKGMYRKQEKYLLFSDSSIFWAKGNVSRQNYFFYSNFMQILFTLVEILKRKNPPHTHQKAGDANKASILGVPILLPSSFFLPA